MKNLMHQIVLCMLLVWCVTSVRAEGIHDKLPADFVRITQLDDLTEDGYYTLGGLAKTGDLVFLSSHLLQNKKMKGVSSNSSLKDKFTFKNPAMVWTLRKLSSGNYALFSATERQCLTRRKTGKLGLDLVKSETSLCAWKVEQTDDGKFYLNDPASESNALSLSTDYYENGEVYYFDNYRSPDTKELYIYKLPTRITDVEGQNHLPENGQRLALWNNGKIRSHTGKGISADEATLCDGSVAPVSTFEVLVAELKGKNKFALRSGDGYLDYDLQVTSSAAVWQILNGHICTEESHPRYLCYDKGTFEWNVLPEEFAVTPATWIPVAEPPSRRLDENGVCALSGGWTATSLASLSWMGVRCLDLTRLALPIHALSFTITSETENLPIFVNASMVEYVPQSWGFVVSCGASNNLLRNTLFVDGAPFYTDRYFSVSEGQLVYERPNSAPGIWHTLCLPFAWTTDEGSVATLQNIDSTVLSWKFAAGADAGMPALVSPFKGNTIRVESMSGTVTAKPGNEYGFRGTFVPMHVKSSAENIYMLDSEGKTFIHAAPNSILAPYKAYIQIN